MRGLNLLFLSMIPTDILESYGAVKKRYERQDIIFREGATAQYYFQVASGEVKMNNFNDDGKEFIQGIFTKGDSFGEPPLFNHKPYPANATVLSDCELWQISRADFMKMLSEKPETAMAVCVRLADRLYYKSIMAMEISSQDPEHRLLRFFDYLKSQMGTNAKSERFHVNLTRQQLADLTGLRVETVIRTVKALEKKGKLVLDGRRILR